MEQKTSPKDVFLHLLSILTLYTSGVAFLVLVFQYVNILFPDILEGGYYALTGARAAIRWSIASLIVVFPVYIFTTWHLNKAYDRNPSQRNLRIRKWLVYFTLFAAALIIIGDLVTLINRLLEGELTARFILKVLAVFFVAGSTFWYYISDLKRHKIDSHA